MNIQIAFRSNILFAALFSILMAALCQPMLFARDSGQGLPQPPQPLQAEMLLKLLSQNQRFQELREDTVKIIIIVDPADPVYADNARQFQEWFHAVTPAPFHAKKLQIDQVLITKIAELDMLKYRGALIISGRRSNISRCLQKCQDAGVVSMSPDPALVRLGVSISVDTTSDRQPEIWFNATSLQLESAVYDSNILELVKHIIW